MRRAVFIFLLFFLGNSGLGASVSSNLVRWLAAFDSIVFSPMYEINVMPLALADFYKPHVRAGFGYSYGKTGFLTEIGLGSNIFKKDEEYGFWEVRLQYRYLMPEGKKSVFYLATEVFINQALYVYDGGFVYGDYEIRADNIHKSKLKYGFNIIYGNKALTFKRVSFDTYIGVGYSLLRIKILSYANARTYEWTTREYIAERGAGLYGSPNFVFGFRINYLLAPGQYSNYYSP